MPIEIDAASRRAQLGWRRLPQGFVTRGPGWKARLDSSGLELTATSGSLVLGPAQLSRGATAIASAREPSVDEFLVSTKGVEQRWNFERPPAGKGPLQVRVPIARAHFSKTTAEGLLFEDHGARFRYGHATWVDATGERTSVAATFEDRAVVLVVPEAVLARSSYPAVLDPLIGPAFDTGGPEWGGGPGLQANCRLATNGSLYLAVWEDQRSGSPDILATRIDASGQVLDRPNLVLSDASGTQSLPRVAWDGTNFLVVWTDASGATEDLGFTRVTPAGAVLDPVGRKIVATSARELTPNLATAGSENLLVWSELGATSFDVKAARFDGTGALIGAPFVISALSGEERMPAASWNGSTWFVAWEDGRSDASDLYGARVSPAGALLDAAGIGIAVNANTPFQPNVAWNGTDHFVLWRENRAGTGSDVLGARVTVGGTVIDPGGFVVAGGPASELLPSLTVLGSDTLVLWTDDRSGASLAWGLEVSSSATLSTVGGVPWALPAANPASVAITSGDAGLYVAWTDSARGNSDVMGALSTRGGVAAGTTAQFLSVAPNRQSVADVVLEGGAAFVVWQDLRGGSWPDLYFTRVSDGGVLDPGGVLIADGVVESNPVVASGGGQYLVVWEASADLRGARFTLAGAPLDPPAGFAVANAVHLERAPAIAWNGSDFVVAWQDRRTTTFDQIYFERISLAGVRLDGTGIALAPSTTDQLTPSVTGLDGGALIVWTDNRAGSDIYAAVVLADGGMGSAVVPVITASGNQFTPASASNGSQQLVVWEDVSGAVRASRLGTDLLPLDGVGLHLGPASSGVPAVAWDGEEFVAVWRDSTTTVREIAMTRITVDGRVLDSPAVRVASTPGDDANPRIACETGQCLVVWDSANTVTSNGRLIRAVQVTPNRSPIASPASVTTTAGSSVAIMLSGTDPDGDSLTFLVTGGPDGGVVQGAPPNLTYDPAPGFSGADELRFVARDATRTSGTAIVSITVVAVDAGGVDAGVVDAGVVDAGVVDAGGVDAGGVDAGGVDAGGVDAGGVDAGGVDAGGVDAGGVDAGVVDAGGVDAGAVDAGAVDAGAVDAGVVDAGAVDAGVVDAGAVDAGAVDAGAENPSPVSGCGCDSAPSLTALFLALATLRRRRVARSP